MYTVLLVLLIIDSIVLALAVLMQAGKGGGVAAAFGGASSSADAFIGMRQAGNLLTKVSWWAGGIFIGLAFVLQVMSTRARVPASVLDQPIAPVTAPMPAPGATPAPAVPLQPAPQADPSATVPGTPPAP
jgi:preprotein translocase subunit SecG